MDVLLIPGLWLDAASWEPVLPPLRRAGLNPRPLTLPGLGEPASRSGEITMAEWVAAVAAEIDRAAEPVALVGHSGGGNVAWAAADARPDRVARVVLVDTTPPPDGGDIAEFPVVDGVVPFPGWDFFDAPDTADLDEATRTRTAPLMRSVPARVPTDPVTLRDPRRFTVPVTILSGGSDETGFRAMLAPWRPYATEFGSIVDVEVVRLDTGHWPQFTQPQRLADAIVAAVNR